MNQTHKRMYLVLNKHFANKLNKNNIERMCIIHKHKLD